VKATKETLSPTRVKLTVEVPFDELKPSVDAAYRKLSRQVRVAGFRPGKVPPRILDQRLGRGVVLDEAIQEALPKFYLEAVQAEQVDVLSRPEVDIAEFADGKQLVFTAEVDVRPKIVLPDMASLTITVDSSEVTEEQIQTELDAMRDRSAVLEPVDRAVRTGDFISMDLSAAIDGEPVDGAETTGASHEVGSGFVAGLDEAVVGATEGESRTFDTELLAGDRSGQTAQVTVIVRGVKEKKLPELDDDFVTTASEFDTLDELREDIRARLDRSRRLEQLAQARERLIDALAEQVQVPLPQGMVDGEIEARGHRLAHELEHIGVDRDTYLESVGKNAEEFDTEVRESAEKAIVSQFLLEAVVEAESIGVDQSELMDSILARAQRSGVSPEEYAEQLADSSGQGLQAVMAEVMRSKALLWLLENATVVDSEGNPVALDLPRRARPELDTDDDYFYDGHDDDDDDDDDDDLAYEDGEDEEEGDDIRDRHGHVTKSAAELTGADPASTDLTAIQAEGDDPNA
jgi:trigger factor